MGKEKVVYIHAPVRTFAEMGDLEKAQDLEKIALEAAHTVETRMSGAIRFAAAMEPHIQGLYAEAAKLRQQSRVAAEGEDKK